MTNKISIGGESKSVRMWVEEFDNGIALSTVYNRMQMGWSLLEALSKPVNSRMSCNNRATHVKHYYDGEMITARQISVKTGYTVNTIRHWLRTGKPIKTRYAKPVDVEAESEPVELSAAEIHISNLIASGASNDHIERCIRSGEIA